MASLNHRGKFLVHNIKKIFLFANYCTKFRAPNLDFSLFFSPITPNARSQPRDTEMGSRPGYNKGVTIDRAMAICRARRPRPHGPRPRHPCHRQIKAIISRHRRCFPRFGDISILDRPMIEIFRRQKLQYT